MSRWMLDTNAVSDLVRAPRGKVAARIAEVGARRVSIGVVVAAELRFGAAKKGSTRLERQVDSVLSAIEIRPMAEPVDRRYAQLRAALERRGTPIGPNDMLIAAHALVEEAILVTANTREFSRVDGLATEDWFAPR